MEIEYVELPNGRFVEVMPAELIDNLHALGKLEIMTNNYIYGDYRYSLYCSKRTPNLYALPSSQLS